MAKLLEGYLRMMSHHSNNPVQYYFSYATYQDEIQGKKPGKCESDELQYPDPMHQWIGKHLILSFSGKIRCVDCGRPTKKSFGGGSCFPCFQSLASNDSCIVKPETCHYHLGTCREPEWGKKHCFTNHTLYFANSSGLKVGITKENPPQKRWIDQGAVQGIPVLTVSSRREAGLLESHLTKFLPDKTSWQKMVGGEASPVFLEAERTKFQNYLSEEKANLPKNPDGKEIIWKNEEGKSTEISYPIHSYPSKVKSYKPGRIQDKLVGIKGQYLLFQNGVINLRSHAGYQFELSVEDAS